MDIIIDGVIYQLQKRGGISRLYNEILPRMCKLDDSLQFTLLTAGRCKQPLPVHARIQHRALFPIDDVLRPGRLWWPVKPCIRACLQRLALDNTKGKIWHSTYYTELEGWEGATVVTVADMIKEHFEYLFKDSTNERFRKQKRHCILATDAVICISESTKSDLQQFYDIDADKIYVVPLAHSPTFRILKQGFESPTEKPFLLYIGNRPHYKNFKLLVQAYSSWPRYQQVDLVVVGTLWTKEEKHWLADLGVIEQIQLLTDVDDQTLVHLYNHASAFVHPSLYEGFGIPLLEAMACGCPIIASYIPSTVEVAGECPIYFEPTKIESLLAAFDVALSEGRNSDRVRLGLEHVKHYSWDKTARKTLKVYSAL